MFKFLFFRLKDGCILIMTDFIYFMVMVYNNEIDDQIDGINICFLYVFVLITETCSYNHFCFLIFHLVGKFKKSK